MNMYATGREQLQNVEIADICFASSVSPCMPLSIFVCLISFWKYSHLNYTLLEFKTILFVGVQLLKIVDSIVTLYFVEFPGSLGCRSGGLEV
jgi:hypothetical protein